MIRVNQANYDAAQSFIHERGWRVAPELGAIFKNDGSRCNSALNSWGYRRFRFGGRSVLEHRVIWESANGPIPADMFINHIDGDKTNNTIANLECVTQRANLRHARTTGLMPGIYGPDPRLADDAFVAEVYREACESPLTTAQVATKHGVSHSWVKALKYDHTRLDVTSAITVHKTDRRLSGK